MKKIKIIFLIIVNMLLLISCNNKKEDINSYFSKTVEIECESLNNKGYATGFFINNDGLIITNKHVIEKFDNETKINIRLSNDEIKEGIIHKISDDYDLVLIKIDYESNYFKFEEEFNIGDNIYSIGNPKGYGLTLYNGIVSSNLKRINYDNESVLSIQTNIEIYEGCSGGPLINENGKILGIMTFRIKENMAFIPGISYAIPSKTIIEFLNSEENL